MYRLHLCFTIRHIHWRYSSNLCTLFMFTDSINCAQINTYTVYSSFMPSVLPFRLSRICFLRFACILWFNAQIINARIAEYAYAEVTTDCDDVLEAIKICYSGQPAHSYAYFCYGTMTVTSKFAIHIDYIIAWYPASSEVYKYSNAQFPIHLGHCSRST